VTLRCVFCGARLTAEQCIWVQLTDGGQFVCCPTVCPPLHRAIEELRRSRAQAAHPIPSPGTGYPAGGVGRGAGPQS
jgi:hypothetical protein